MMTISKKQMDTIEQNCSRQAGKSVKAVLKCQRNYFIRVKWVAPTGSTPRKQLASLPGIPAKPTDFIIHCFVDTQQDEHHYDNSRVPQGLSARWRQGEIDISVDEDTYNKAQRVFLWASEMRASFWHKGSHDEFATGRLWTKSRKEEEDQYNHVLNFEAQVLISPVDYLAGEIVKNMKEDIVKDTREHWPEKRKAYKQAKAKYEKAKSEKEAAEYFLEMKAAEHFLMRWVAINGEKNIENYIFGWLVANLLSTGLYDLKYGQYGKWDYKPLISAAWGDFVRLGNHAKACPAGAFSNFHYGYISAAAGLSENTTLGLGNWGQQVSTGENDPPEDVAATKAGHAAFDASDDEEKIRSKLMSFLNKHVNVDPYGVTLPVKPPPKFWKSAASAVVSVAKAKSLDDNIDDMKKDLGDAVNSIADAIQGLDKAWTDAKAKLQYCRDFEDRVWDE